MLTRLAHQVQSHAVIANTCECPVRGQANVRPAGDEQCPPIRVRRSHRGSRAQERRLETHDSVGFLGLRARRRRQAGSQTIRSCAGLGGEEQSPPLRYRPQNGILGLRGRGLGGAQRTSCRHLRVCLARRAWGRGGPTGARLLEVSCRLRARSADAEDHQTNGDSEVGGSMWSRRSRGYGGACPDGNSHLQSVLNLTDCEGGARRRTDPPYLYPSETRDCRFWSIPFGPEIPRNASRTPGNVLILPFAAHVAALGRVRCGRSRSRTEAQLSLGTTVAFEPLRGIAMQFHARHVILKRWPGRAATICDGLVQ